MNEERLPPEIAARIQGDISGQVAIGSYILQVGAMSGGVIQLLPQQQQPVIHPRTPPVYQRPRPFPDLLDREQEITQALHALEQRQCVEISGEVGAGKTTLLRSLAYQVTASTFPEGIIYLSARHQYVMDIAQDIFDALYESTLSYKPTSEQLCTLLQHKQVLIFLDDTELARDDISQLLQMMTESTFTLANTARQLWGEGQHLLLAGLPDDVSARLFTRELNRQLPAAEYAAVRQLCSITAGNPLQVLHLAALVRDAGLLPSALAARIHTLDDMDRMTAQLLDQHTADERLLIAVLAAVNGTALSTAAIAAGSGLEHPQDQLMALCREGIVEQVDTRYRLRRDMLAHAQDTWDLDPVRKRLLTSYSSEAETYHHTPLQWRDQTDALIQILSWAVGIGRWQEVLPITRVLGDTLALTKHWAAWGQVVNWSVQAAESVGNATMHAWALSQLGTRALLLGDASTAQSALSQSLAIREAHGEQLNAAVTRHNLDVLNAPAPPPASPTVTTVSRHPFPAWAVLGAIGLGILLVLLGGYWYWQTRTQQTITVLPPATPPQNAEHTLPPSSNTLPPPDTPSPQATQVPTLAALILDAPAITGGQTVHGAVSLASPAPPGGATVAMTSDQPDGIVITPSKVAIPIGKTSGQFTVQTSVVRQDTSATITATLGDQVQRQRLAIRAEIQLTELTIVPNEVTAPSKLPVMTHVPKEVAVAGTIKINRPAPENITVDIRSNHTLAQPDQTTTIPVGKDSADFTIKINTPSANTPSGTSEVTITAIAVTPDGNESTISKPLMVTVE